jgi:hypothetical protein
MLGIGTPTGTPAMNLTARDVRTAKLPSGERELPHNDGDGLDLRVREHSKT